MLSAKGMSEEPLSACHETTEQILLFIVGKRHGCLLLGEPAGGVCIEAK